MADILKIANREFRSRLMVGTGIRRRSGDSCSKKGES